MEVVTLTVGHGGLSSVVLCGTADGVQESKPSEKFQRRTSVPCSTILIDYILARNLVDLLAISNEYLSLWTSVDAYVCLPPAPVSTGRGGIVAC